MKHAHEMPWPPTPGEPYWVDDCAGGFVEIIEDGAIDDAEAIVGSRVFLTEMDEWNDDFTERRIKRIAAISAT